MSARALRLALIGQPVAHSLSPAIFARLSALEGQRCDYSVHEVAPVSLPAWFAVDGRALDGFNVTAPHKTAAAAACARLTSIASDAGAVNCVRFDPEDGYLGHNTDVEGFEFCLVDGRFERALVLGAGGAARAVLLALRRLQVKAVEVRARDPRAIEAWYAGLKAPAALSLSVNFGDLQTIREAFVGRDLVVQCTSAALRDPEAFADLPFSLARPGAMAVDLVYRPRCTGFLAGALRAGLTGVDGLSMLAAQAVAGHDFFSGRSPLGDLATRATELAAWLRAAPD